AAAADLARLGVEVRFGEPVLPGEASLLVVSPGWRPGHPLVAAALRAGVEVIGEVELAWRLRDGAGPGSERSHDGGGAAAWLAITGTNGKTTAVRMLTAMLTAAG